MDHSRLPSSVVTTEVEVMASESNCPSRRHRLCKHKVRNRSGDMFLVHSQESLCENMSTPLANRIDERSPATRPNDWFRLQQCPVPPKKYVQLILLSCIKVPSQLFAHINVHFRRQQSRSSPVVLLVKLLAIVHDNLD